MRAESMGSDSIAGGKTEQLLKPNNGLEADGPQRILLGLSQRYRLWAAADRQGVRRPRKTSAKADIYANYSRKKEIPARDSH